MKRLTDITTIEKVCIVTREILEIGHISNRRVRELTGMSRSNAHRMLSIMARRLGLYLDDNERVWYLIDDMS